MRRNQPSDFMMRHGPTACGSCASRCADLHEECTRWASAGQCVENESFMNMHAARCTMGKVRKKSVLWRIIHTSPRTDSPRWKKKPHSSRPASAMDDAPVAPRLASALPAHVLARGLLHPGGADLGFARFWHRLHEGRPVTITALGTSVTALAAGCTHSLVPGCTDCCGARRYGEAQGHASPRKGFLRRALEWINESWPHAGHALYNGGRPGAGGLENFVGCFSSWVPAQTDLFVLEVGGTGNMPEAIEAVVRRIYRLRPHTQRPAILILELWNSRWYSKSTNGRPMRDGYKSMVAALSLARYYDFALASEHDLLFHEYYSGRLLPSQIKRDAVHPSSMEAAHLFADFATWVLYASHASWRTAGPFGARGIVVALRAAPIPSLLYNDTLRYGGRSLACYSFDPERTLLQSFSHSASRFVIDAEGGLAPTLVANSGWRFIREETTGVNHNKPGIVSTTHGAELAVRLLPVMKDLSGNWIAPPHHGSWARRNDGANSPDGGMRRAGRWITISIRYLTSYHRMGAANVSCSDGCECKPLTLDGHTMKRESVERIANLQAWLETSQGGPDAKTVRPLDGGKDEDNTFAGGSCVLYFVNIGRLDAAVVQAEPRSPVILPDGQGEEGNDAGRFKIARLVVSESKSDS